MRAVVQRVSEAAVEVAGEEIARIGPGLLVLLGVGRDGDAGLDWLAEKVAHLRVFDDDNGQMNRSVLDVGGAVLVVSQFTLYGDTRRGRRPGYSEAAPPEAAEPIIARFVERLRELGAPVQSGRFRAHMGVSLVNDGPVTLILQSPPAPA